MVRYTYLLKSVHMSNQNQQNRTFSKTASSCFSLLQSAKINGTSLFVICETRFKLTAFPSLSSKINFINERIKRKVIKR